MTEHISLGYSPCPNDTFIFYGLVHGRIEGAPEFREVLEDIETLNRFAIRAELDITKISFHAFAHLRESYCLLRSGGALGRGCGPLVISKQAIDPKDLADKRVAIPQASESRKSCYYPSLISPYKIFFDSYA